MTAVTGQAVTALPGSQFPLGATVCDGGTNFAVASAVADGMLLCLFDEGGTPPSKKFLHRTPRLLSGNLQ